MPAQTFLAYQGAGDTIVVNSNLQGIAFSQKALRCALITDPYGRLEGEEGTGAAIITKRGLVGEGTQRVKLPITGHLGAGVRRAEAELAGSEEPLPMNSMEVKATVRRHATAVSEQFKEFIAGGKDANSQRAQLLGHHFGWMKSHEAGLKLRNDAEVASNVYFANGKANVEAIRSGDTVTWAEVVRAHHYADDMAHIDPMNLNAIQSDARTITKLLLFGPKACFHQLKTDQQYLTVVTNADVRGVGKNVAFTGEFATIDNVAFNAYQTLSPNETAGIIGCPLAPLVRLSAEPGQVPTVAIGALNVAANTTNVVLYSTRSVNPVDSTVINNLIWENFSLMPGALYTYDPLDISAGGAGTLFGTIGNKYALLYDPSDGLSTMVWYTGVAADFPNRGNTMRVQQRMSTSLTSLTGSTVVYNTGAWAGKMKSTGFMPGTLVIPCNSQGVPLCFPQMLGSGALTRCYGRDFTDIKQEQDYGEFKGMGYRTVFGSAINRSAFGPPRGYLQMVAARSMPSTNLPQIN